MSLHYLWFGSYWRNVTSPLTHWHRGTAVHIDTMKDFPESQVVIGELGTDMVMFAMAARITQSIFTLARNLLHRRPLGWKIISGDWKSKAFQAVLWMCWNIIDILLAMEVTNVMVYKNLSKHSTHCHTAQSMNTISIKCHWACKAELNTQTMDPEKDLHCSQMENLQEHMDIEEVCDPTMFPDIDIMMSKETLLPSCTNPFILSMICVPSEDGESLTPSEQSDLSESESGDESDGDGLLPCEESSHSESESGDEDTDSSLEDTSVDSGMQESWNPKSKQDMDEGQEESDWSDEEEDSWDEESDADNSRDDELWASFCRNDDPYNPLSFAMPTKSHKTVKKEVPPTICEKQVRAKSCPSIAGNCQSLNCTTQSQRRKPVLSGFRCSHKCSSQKSESLDECPGVKKVRFSSNVAVHRMVTWSYASRMARKGPWEEYARDRTRFQKRIAETEAAIGYCLESGHRQKIWAARRCKEN